MSISHPTTAILAETEGRYQSFPHYVEPGAPRRFEVVVTFRRAPPEVGDEGEAGSGESEDAASASRARTNPRDVTVMTVQVGPRDTVDTLNKRIRVSRCFVQHWSHMVVLTFTCMVSSV